MQKMKIAIVSLLSLFVLVYCCEQSVTLKGPAEKKSVIPVQGSSSNKVSDNFLNGDFQQSVGYEKEVALNTALNPSFKLRDSEKALLEHFKRPLVLYPWRVRGDVSLVHENDNILAQLKVTKGGEVSLSQDIIFRNKNARIEFDLFVVGGTTQGVFEVAVLDVLDRFQVASYQVSAISSGKHYVIDVSDNKNFIARKASEKITVEFSLRGKEQDSAVVRLDAITIAYQ